MPTDNRLKRDNFGVGATKRNRDFDTGANYLPDIRIFKGINGYAVITFGADQKQAVEVCNSTDEVLAIVSKHLK